MVKRIGEISFCFLLILCICCTQALATQETESTRKVLPSDDYRILSEAELPVTDICDVAIGQYHVMAVYQLKTNANIYAVFTLDGDFIYAYKTVPMVFGVFFSLDDEGNATVLQTRAREVSAYTLYNPYGAHGEGIEEFWPNAAEEAKLRDLSWEWKYKTFTVYTMGYDRLSLSDKNGDIRIIFDHSDKYVDLYGKAGPLFRQWHLLLIIGGLVLAAFVIYLVHTAKKPRERSLLD